ncbi:B''ALPHA Serine/threonine protein phosphatase 2A regulatory subunit B''alpha [Nymphaea thermarum]|nr:B''ALPHA Serine/threonine protein phosphatase 2A regulatory subunit B''alpha [Nymphaea thermarum]
MSSYPIQEPRPSSTSLPLYKTQNWIAADADAFTCFCTVLGPGIGKDDPTLAEWHRCGTSRIYVKLSMVEHGEDGSDGSAEIWVEPLEAPFGVING